MLEGIVADVLVRVLGSYVDGLNRESIRVGVWRGDLELTNLRIRQDALAILFETLGLDLPVTVTAGYIGLLRLEVPWKTLRSAPVRIFMQDVNVVASPVSDGDQSALEFRERRLKSARLATDEALRDAKFSVRSELNNRPNAPGDPSELPANSDSQGQGTAGGNRMTRWGWRFTSRVVTRIIDNIQIDVENVIIQYEDASSVRDSPYTSTLALDSLRACSADRNWNRVFIESPDSPIVHKVLHARGLVLNWEPGNSNNDLRDWILDSSVTRTPGHWAKFVRAAKRHAIRPMDGELRIALTKSAALASALAGSDPSLSDLRNIPRVQMDLHFPSVHIALDDFQYHTLLSTIMYLSDIDRKVRPKTARGRWFWALDRLLPRFKERREAVQRFNARDLRLRREARLKYCEARNAVVEARRNGVAEPTAYASVVEELENQFRIADILHFRDLADRELYSKLSDETTPVTANLSLWSLFSRARVAPSQERKPNRSTSRESIRSEPVKDPSCTGNDSSLLLPSSLNENAVVDDHEIQLTSSKSEGNVHSTLKGIDESHDDGNVPNFRMGFLLGRGAVELREVGAVGEPIPRSSLEFRELRLGIETKPQSGFLLEALLGTFEVIDMQKQMKVMYPRVPWAGENADIQCDNEAVADDLKHLGDPNSSISQIADEWVQENQAGGRATLAPGNDTSESVALSPVLHSYPHGVSDAICEIRGEYGVESSVLPIVSPRFNSYRSSNPSESSSSLSGFSDCGLSGISTFNREDLSVAMHSPLKYIAALRLNEEEATEGDWASGATRMAMDLAIGGMEVLIDGPKSAFISSVSFWHPREKMPSIMQFLTKAAAPRLASLRMDIQKAILERSVPMRMDLLIRGPRFVVPGPPDQDLSLVLDMGTFAMETSTGSPELLPPEFLTKHSARSDGEHGSGVDNLNECLSVRYTDYKMAFIDLGLYVVSEAGRHAAECIIRPFSVHLLLEVLHNSSFIEAITLPYGKVDIAKVKLQGKLISLRTSVSHHAFRQILDTTRAWDHRSRKPLQKSGIEPNRVSKSLTVSAEMEEVRQSHNQDLQQSTNPLQEAKSPLVSFEMIVELEDLQLELRDSLARRIVTISSTGTLLQMKKRAETLDFDYRVRSFTVTDGSRGATAPFRRLAYAGVDNGSKSTPRNHDDRYQRKGSMADSRSFITLSYRGDVVNHEQMLSVKILSLNLVCVRESYFALADFFYLNDVRKKESSGKKDAFPDIEEETTPVSISQDEVNAEYSDPFAALGMTTSGAAQALRHQAGRGMEISKQVIANRGRLSVMADLDGLNLTLVTAEGAIACFDVTNCKTHLLQYSDGSVQASGDLGGFGVRDLTSAFDVYSETIRYKRKMGSSFGANTESTDGWKLTIPPSGTGDVELHAHLRNIRIVYLHRFIIILKKYFDVLRQSLKPVLEMKGGLGEVFDAERGEDFPAEPPINNRVNVNIITESIDIVMPRHSQSPYEALRFFVPRSSITNTDIAAPGYQIGAQIKADGVDTYVLYQAPAEGEGRALTEGGTEPVLKHITPNSPIEDLTPFSTDISLVAKLDIWRRRRVPQVVLNADGLPVLKDGEEEREYDPAKWLPAIRVRVSAPNGIVARLCEAEYSILYFTFTENVIERPEIEFTDLVRGLKTPVLPARKPVQPIMFSSNKMPPNYKIIFEVPRIDSVIMSGADPLDDSARLIRSQLRDLIGSFDYGVDYRMTIELNANMHSVIDIRPGVPSFGKTLITPTSTHDSPQYAQDRAKGTEMTRSVTFTWDRPFGFRSNVMVVASDLRIIVEPELFRDLGSLTPPGFPYLRSSAPPPLLRFNGRLLIATVSRPEVWFMANQFPGDGRSLVMRGDIIAKVQWAAVTGRQTVEVAANGIRVNLSNIGPEFRSMNTPKGIFSGSQEGIDKAPTRKDTETPMLYPCDISMQFDGSGYDPPEHADGEAVKVPGSSLSINAESVLVRVDVNDTPLILAVGSRLVRLKPSAVSRRPVQPGRFDQWIDKDDDGDSKLSIHFALPHSRLMFTDETAGRYVPIMEARIRNAVVRSNVPWLTNAAFEFALDLFNEDKGWWEPGIEMFPLKIAASEGRSGSRAVHVHSERNIDVNVTPNTVSGAARVSKALKSAIVDLTNRIRHEQRGMAMGVVKPNSAVPRPLDIQSATNAKRPSVAAFCVRNVTGRSMVMWLPYDSKRQCLRGNGGEIEVDPPSEELLWTAVGATGFVSSDPNKNRQLSLSCNLSLSGYVAKSFSTAQTGTWLVTLEPDAREMPSPSTGDQSRAVAVTLVWSVAMRDGVPCGCIRSVLRIINRTRTVLEVNIGGLRKSASLGSALKTLRSDITDDSSEDEGLQLEHEPHGLVQAGESWSIPIHSIHRAIRIRPAIFHAPEGENYSDYEAPDNHGRSRVYYTYKWSDPLSKISALHNVGTELYANAKEGDLSTPRVSEKSILSGPVLTCRADDRKNVFTMMLQPKIDTKLDSPNVDNKEVPGWVDVHVCPPLIIENLLPRPMYFKLALPGTAKKVRSDLIKAEGFIEPLREAHVHTVGSNLSRVALAVGMDNSPVHDTTSPEDPRALSSRHVGDFLPNFASLRTVSMGIGRYTPFFLTLDQEKKVSTRHVRAYCDFWIRNRSDTDLFFRDKESNRDTKNYSRPKVFLRGRPPGVKADKFVCFSGRWLTFQRADATEDIWVNVCTEVNEIDKPIQVRFEKLSLLLDVRPAKGKLHRALIVTIRNAVWFENRTGAVLQWCQPSALNAHGIALSSSVHGVKSGEFMPVHWDFMNRRKAICLRRANEDGSSEWIWSRPVSVEGVEGEFVAKMYRPKRHEQYIARVTISKLRNGVLGVVVHREDRNTPPYRIVNRCPFRSIAFRQSGVHETHPWLVRPGKSSRYSWDDPQAPVKKRSLVVEVIESGTVPKNSLGSSSSSPTLGKPNSEQLRTGSTEALVGIPSSNTKREREIRYPKFDLNIDLITNHVPFSHSSRFDPPLVVSVHVDGPTKVVTFSDGVIGEINEPPGAQADNRQTSTSNVDDYVSKRKYTRNLDVELYVNALGISFVDSAPTELAYFSVTGIHFRLDRFDGQQLFTCEVQDLQLDNQLVRCSWPVVVWSPPPIEIGSSSSGSSSQHGGSRRPIPKPFFQFTADGPYPSISQGIASFRGIFIAIQQLQIAADEDFVLRVWLFVASLIEAAGGSNFDKEESLNGMDGLEISTPIVVDEDPDVSESDSVASADSRSNRSLKRIYVEHLELCPLKLTISFTSSRTSTAAERIGGFRSFMRTLVAVLGNVENAEFRFNALELHHMFDSISHFRSLITEFYVSQGSNQKMVLLASNSLIGNPSALFDSIAIGTRDFFVEPANAKGSADFIASIGRGSSSLLTNTVGGLVGSIGAIPRAVAQGLETAVGDRDYLAERDAIRGGRARIVSSPAQGLITGALSFGHGIASAAAGLIRDPIQGAAEEGASGFIKGLGKGFIGGVLKPITGALDLIAEPAAGFRSMMVSDRKRESAEPVRPPRAFWGANGDQMTSYDLRASLGHAVFEAVNGNDNIADDERMVSWTHLMAVHHSANEEQVIAFLWALMRRSTRSSHFQTKYLLDAQGNPQRADKMRAGLVTSKRLIITSMDGHVLWEYPLMDIVDTQVSLEARDYLMVGVRPIGYNSRIAIAPQWKKIHCGSMTARDELNSSLRKVVQERRLASEAMHDYNSKMVANSEKERTSDEKERRNGSTGRQTVSGKFVEMTDLSVNQGGDSLGQSVEMKSLHRDASADGKRDVFTSLKLPGRGLADQTSKVASDDGKGKEGPVLSQEADKLASIAGAERMSNSVRSMCMLIVNELDRRLIVRPIMESGRWAKEPPSMIEANSVVQFHADCGEDRVRDILGSLTLSLDEKLQDGNSDDGCAIRFFNPLLAANAFAIKNATWVDGTFKGGEKGDHVVTVLTLKRRKDDVRRPKGNSVEMKRNNKAKADPLLFGRSMVTPFPPRVTVDPPNAPREAKGNPEDPELIGKLSSLGFSEQVARRALLECEADVSAAYAKLVGGKSTNAE